MRWAVWKNFFSLQKKHYKLTLGRRIPVISLTVDRKDVDELEFERWRRVIRLNIFEDSLPTRGDQGFESSSSSH